LRPGSGSGFTKFAGSGSGSGFNESGSETLVGMKEMNKSHDILSLYVH